MHIIDASGFAKWFWPTFVVNDGLVFLELAKGNTTYDTDLFPDRTTIESFFNHMHILDVFENDAAITDEPFWNANHPHFKLACELGRTLAHSWAHKLSLDFPNRWFRVYYTREDNPIVRFHQVHAGEPPWLDSHPLESGEERVLILNVKRSQFRVG